MAYTLYVNIENNENNKTNNHQLICFGKLSHTHVPVVKVIKINLILEADIKKHAQSNT